MPFLRFSRDKRGYESTYLCHTFRRGGKPELRVLYWFRTPPDVKVGRLALDPVAIRAIEESNPDLKFDWGKILKVKPPPPPPDYDRDGRERRRRGRGTGAANAPVATNSTSATVQIAAPAPVVPTDVKAEPAGPESAVAAPAPAIAAWDDPDLGDEPAGPAERRPTHVVLGLTDEQGLARLRARHAEIQVRISERVRDPAKLEELRAQAALLDPDAWRTVEEARERLASLDAATDAIRKVLGRRRRSRRGGARRRSRQQSGPGGVSESGDGEPAATPEATSPAASPPPSEAPADPPHE
jgi:hypothetical protein